MTVRIAIKYSVFSQIFIRLLGLISIVVLARLLTPSEFGVFAIASSAIFIAQELQNLGTSNYLIREKEVTLEMKRLCTGLALIISWSIALLVFMAAPFLAKFYNILDLEYLFRLFSIIFLISPFIVVPNAMLTRNMQFKRLFISRATSQTIGFLVTMAFVLNGFSYFSMAYGQLATVILSLLLNRLLAPADTPWKPQFLGMGEIFSVGIKISAANLLNRFSLMASDLVIGKLGTTRDVAIYSRGLGFLDFLRNILTMGISAISLPYLSQINRENGDLLAAYIRSTNLLGSICWPVFAVAAVINEPVIDLFFGSQWEESAQLIPALAIWMLFTTVHSFSPALFSASKNENARLIKDFLVFTVTFSTIYGLYDYGLIAVSWGMACVGVFDFLLTTILIKIYLKMNATEFIASLARNAALVISCYLTTYTLGKILNFELQSSITVILEVAIVLPVAWFMLLRILKLELADEIIIQYRKIVGK